LTKPNYYHRDRKRKKFVGESEKDAPRKKRIKTESGHWIQASFKSNAYKEWKERHRVDDIKDGETGVRGTPGGGHGRENGEFGSTLHT
jgi:ATP-dependent RNA helicase DDX54/DBP10